MGGIVFITYICENHWIFPHSGKEYSRDLFMFVCLMFFLVAYYTIAPVKDLTLLSRDQTEEWKGWMQFIFLLYHYFHAEEVYNSVRIMITCYVWMTGFGNFSFFFIKQDFGWLRYVQMLWRLNFSVVLLMFAHNNTYILYYICPLHTFYFTLVYCTMFIMSSVNHSKWGIRVKLFLLGCLIYCIWDISGRFFDLFWGWMSTDTIIGAKLGTLWEWYFRSSLDHYSTYFGMIFALNFPLAEQYFHSARGYPLYFASVVMGVLSIWWYQNIYSLEKMEYNLVHNYFAFIPLTAYIFFRNISPGVRSKVSMSLHALGKTTLETYLLQHHVWLTSNAKTLLTIVPNMPWVNFFLASILFYILSKELYRLTMTLRGMILPDNGTIAARNLIGGIVIFALGYLIAAAVFYIKPTLFVIFLACVFCFLMATLVIRSRGTDCKTNKHFDYTWKLMFVVFAIILAVGMMSTALFDTSPLPPQLPMDGKAVSTPVLTQRCRNMATSGHWQTSTKCDAVASTTTALCASSAWHWDTDPSCPFHRITANEGMQLFKNKKVIFLGDSQSRSMYHSFNKLVSKDYVENTVVRHGDLSNHDDKLGLSVDFKWAPYMFNVTSAFKDNCASSNRADFYVIGATLWDVLHSRDVDLFQNQLRDFVKEMENCGAAKSNQAKGKVIWLTAPSIVDSRLATPEKQQFMTEKQVDVFRHAADNVGLRKVVATMINPVNITSGKESTALDGVHYSTEVYDVLAEIVANVFSADNGLVAPKPSKKNPFPNGKPTGSMSNPKLGFYLLLLSAVMIFGWDSFLGIGMVSLWLFGIKPDWERAYRPLLDMIMPEKKKMNEEEKMALDEERERLIEMEAK